MNIHETIKNVKIETSILYGLMGRYMDNLEKINPDAGKTIKELISERGDFEKNAMRATADAVIYSTLLATLNDDEEFNDAIGNIVLLSDNSLNKMRYELFQDGVKNILETIKEDAQFSNEKINKRIKYANQVLS
jgi:hypothetical protein